MPKETQTVTVDGRKYSWDALSKEARVSLLNLNATDEELKRLRVQVGIAQTARRTFAEALKTQLPKG